MRDKLLQDKSEELQELLTKWAEENKILIPGEQLVFTLRIGGVPTVIEDISDSLGPSVLDLTMEEFFTYSRLEAAGLVKPNIAAARSALLNALGGKTPLREFLRKVPDEETAAQIRNIGKTRLTPILPILTRLWALERAFRSN